MTKFQPCSIFDFHNSGHFGVKWLELWKRWKIKFIHHFKKLKPPYMRMNKISTSKIIILLGFSSQKAEVLGNNEIYLEAIFKF